LPHENGKETGKLLLLFIPLSNTGRRWTATGENPASHKRRRVRNHFTLTKKLGVVAVIAGLWAGTILLAQDSTPASPGAAAPVANPPLPLPPLPPLDTLSQLQGKIVRDIRFRGVQEDQRVFDRLRGDIAQQAGTPLSRDKIRRSLATLYASGRFSDLRVEAQQTSPREVTLVFVALPNFFIGSMTAEGLPKRPTNSQVIDAAKLQLGEVVTRTKLEQATERIKTLLQQNGFYNAEVLLERMEHPETQLVDLHIKIVPGEPAHIGQLIVQGDAGYSTAEIARMADLESGHTVNQARITKALQRLRSKYIKQHRLESQASLVDRLYHPDTNTLDLTLKVQRGPTVAIGVEGASLSRSQLKKYVPVFEENAVDDDLLNEGRRNIRDYLQVKGYFDAKVDFNQDYVKDKDHVNIVYNVDRGEKHDLVKVLVDIRPGKYIGSGQQPPFFSDQSLRERLQVTPKSIALSHGRYSQELMNQDVDSLTALYRSNGFLDVKVESSILDDYEGKDGNLAVRYLIDEGPQTKVGSLTIVGNKSFHRDDLPIVNTAQGQSYSESNIALDRDAILNFYFDKGFPNTRFDVKVVPTPNVPNSRDVTFTIAEGSQFFVDRILKSNLEFTRPYVVDRQLAIKPADPLSQSQMTKTQSNLYNLGIFNEVRMAVQNPEGEAKYKDVLMQFTEAKRWTFNYGVGLEASTGQPDQRACQQLAEQGETSLACSQGRTGVSPRASFDVSRINFRGLAHTLTLKTTIGRLQKRGLVSYEAPRWFGSPKWTLTFTAFYDNSVNVTTFTSERLEGSIQADDHYSRVSEFLFRLTYRRVKASNVVVSQDQVPLYSRPVRVGIPSFTYIRDKRDDPIDAHNGNFTTLDMGVSSKYFGSQASFGRFLIQNATYHPFKKKNANANSRWVFARNLRIGVAEPFGNDFIPLPERFFAGGSNLLRGFALNQAGPRDLTTGTPLGGNAVFVNSMELRTPGVALPFIGDNMSFVFFHDFGNVFTDGKEMIKSLGRWYQPRRQDCRTEASHNLCSFAYMSQSVGSGIRYKTPIGPVRVDFGYNLNPSTYPAFEPDANGKPAFSPHTTRRINVFFSIGQTF
jgi:outer membrane protein assembly complex protein YaeT